MGAVWRRLWPLLLPLCLLIALSHAQDPKVEVTRFDSLPLQLTYFDDSEAVVYHDVINGDVWISYNEGKAWSTVPGVPRGKAIQFILHPFRRSMAFILAEDTTHYRTEDHGKTWRSFTLPVITALSASPLSFHSDPDKWGYILFQGMQCESGSWLGAKICHDKSYYTKDAFSSEAKPLLEFTRSCNFAHSSKDFKHSAHSDLVFCVAWDVKPTDDHHRYSSKLYQSNDFFQSDRRVVNFPEGNRGADGVIAFAIVSKFAVTAVRDRTSGAEEMWLFVSVDADTWAKARFPHASSSQLRENAYTIVESTTHSLAVDVLLHPASTIGTLFVSNSNGTYFVQSLQNTNRNSVGFVDFETIYGVEGVGLANVVGNAEDVDGRNAERALKSFATFDDGSNWAPVNAPKTDVDNKPIGCDVDHPSSCSLHLHSVTSPHNFGRVFSSPAPGLVMGVGNVGTQLLPYEQCDTFLSTDAGATWRMVRKNAHKYEFGNQGSIIVIADDEEIVDHVWYSFDYGNTWKELKLGVSVRVQVLTTVPDSTSQKFLLIGTLSRADKSGGDKRPIAAIFLDFADIRKDKCKDNQLEKWNARNGKGKECLMGHKQWYWRKKANENCYVGEKFKDPEEHEENCVCDDDDYECDFNYIRSGNECIPQGPEPIPAGVCADPSPGNTYLGSSGYRLIPGDTCEARGGKKKDDPVRKECSKAELPEGEISHQIFEFSSRILQHEYFKDSQTILVRLADLSVWQSSNEGYTWFQVKPEERFLAFYFHRHASDRAYLVTATDTIYRTVNGGKTWESMRVPLPANTLDIPVMSFHPLQSDWLIWIGSTSGCATNSVDCHAVAYYSTNNGGSWYEIETYVKSCAWARDTDLKIDSRLVICESYREKAGSQALFGQMNPVELWVGSQFYKKKTKLFDNVVGFAKFSEYLIVAELHTDRHALDLQVSLDGKKFATGMFPPSMRPDNHAYTVLESNTDSVFLHLTISERLGFEYGNILKSNSNGTFYGVTIENVNRNKAGYVDFEKMIGLDGIAVVNIVSNPSEGSLTGNKLLQSRITHNDGGSWKPLVPPLEDANGQKYPCTTTSCSLHIHGYTERWDPRATYSTPSVPGLMMAVGNVGESLAEYTDSDTFLSRDAGFTWEEVHKDAHLWEFGDSGSILVMTNDEVATDHVTFSTNEGLAWREYSFGTKVRVKSIVTVPSDTSRKFILFGYYPQAPNSAVAVHVDFSSLTRKQCVLSLDDPGNDDFELWSPSEERDEKCLFGRKTLYHRRIRDRNCYVGNQPKLPERLVDNCTCTASDFECEFNYNRDASGNCVLGKGLTPLASEESVCWNTDDEFWYERTAYRKIPHSSCERGQRLDRGKRHTCPGPKSKGALFWWTIVLLPFAFTGLAAWWYTKKSGLARGTIRLPDQRGEIYPFADSGPLATIASIPYFIVGIAGVAWEYVASRLPNMRARTRRGYRNVPVDEDAQVLHFEDEE